uniref:Potassium channel subfamily K member 13 n=1 Tax=Syphacia muris TaxID=451379 RepID=A0A0N5ASC6_9BILA
MIVIGCFARLGISEENARFVLLAIIIFIYLTIGALIFYGLEYDNEQRERAQYGKLLESVSGYLCKRSKKLCQELYRLLELRGNLTIAGFTSDGERFDIPGSFFFAGTVISTIGFGMATPRTTSGRIVTVLYGFIGCTCCVLFFNLFLERLITIFTYLLRSLDGTDKNWRPSVYKVFFLVFALCAVLISTSAAFYSVTERWYYPDALYFCFIGFGTIGFGDFVPNQLPQYEYPRSFIRIANFFILSLGASSVYCLFNVASMVIRQLLNMLIKRMDVKITDSTNFLCLRRKRKRYMGLGLRPPPGYDPTEASSCSSDGLLSLKEFLMNNQTSLLTIQRHLIQGAAATKILNQTEKISANRIGPMGLLTEKFGDG